MIQITAPAKINLGLEVVRRRDDGYHDINTLFAAIDLCDEIRLQLRDDREITCTVDGDERLKSEAIENNLCVKAVRKASEHLGEERGLDIYLRKQIPTGAGLGGGSSDAAAVLKGALSLWDRDIDPTTLLQIALSLGSDVPFFLQGGVAHGSSRGEILQPVEIELPYHCLVVNPGIHIPTPWAYREVKRTVERGESDLVAHIWEGLHDPLSMRRHLVNDFEPPVFAAYPEIGEIKERLYHHGALFALMSGSGSTLFGLFETRERADKAQEGFGEYWSRVARFA
ncbi:MAG: 4-(cytidine 5'-diphospho)-2-C-methyl-D-erythritol kinase [Candidatus Kapaibacterium sp.]